MLWHLILPLTLEPTAHWYFLAGPLAALMLGVVGVMLRTSWGSGWKNIPPRSAIACLLLTGLALCLLLQPVGYSFRLDRDGITLRAPFDPLTSSGTIAWSELRDVRLGQVCGRRCSPTVEFVGQSGTVLTLKSLDGVPAAYWPNLVGVIEANAPGFRFQPDPATWLDRVKARAQPEPGSFGGDIYAARDGTGARVVR